MAHAYYIALHHKPEQFQWLFEAIYTADDLFLIHVDRSAPDAVKAAVGVQTAGLPNVVTLPSRTVQWGGWSQVDAELRALRYALGQPANWQYFINLSGQDYPIKSRDEIGRCLDAAAGRNFIRAVPFATIAATEPDDPHLRKRTAVEVFGHVVRLPFRLPAVRGLDTDYKGSQWHMLSHEFCQWALADPVARTIARHLRFARIPDEIFFPALIMNSPFRDLRMPDCGRLFLWPGPKTLGVDDLGLIEASSDLFARKFDATIDREVLEVLARQCAFPVPAESD